MTGPSCAGSNDRSIIDPRHSRSRRACARNLYPGARRCSGSAFARTAGWVGRCAHQLQRTPHGAASRSARLTRVPWSALRLSRSELEAGEGAPGLRPGGRDGQRSRRGVRPRERTGLCPPPAPSVSRAAAVASLSLVPPSSEPRRWLQYGNTCYCNSVLQALYFCKPFREHVSGYRPAWLAEGEKVRGISSPSRCGSAADAAVTGRGSLSLSLFLSQSLDTSAAAATVAATTNATAIEVALAAAALAGE